MMTSPNEAARQKLLQALDRVESLASGSKWQRLLARPGRYASTALFNQLLYPKKKQAKKVVGKTFYGLDFQLGLPAGTDIYLTGGKTHPSELRLSRFMIRHFKTGDSYVDVGGHYGFFAGLGKHLVGDGTVDVFEPAPDTFGYLQRNLGHLAIKMHQLGLANQNGHLTFHQFPALYSEYNSFDFNQYRDRPWLEAYPPQRIGVPITTLDSVFSSPPNWLKIDVEGLEDLVIVGGLNLLMIGKTVISMEYLPTPLSNGSHARARQTLLSMGYQTYRIDDSGLLHPCPDPEAHLAEMGQDSTNLIFATKAPHTLI